MSYALLNTEFSLRQTPPRDLDASTACRFNLEPEKNMYILNAKQIVIALTLPYFRSELQLYLLLGRGTVFPSTMGSRGHEIQNLTAWRNPHIVCGIARVLYRERTLMLLLLLLDTAIQDISHCLETRKPSLHPTDFAQLLFLKRPSPSSPSEVSLTPFIS